MLLTSSLWVPDLILLHNFEGHFSYLFRRLTIPIIIFNYLMSTSHLYFFLFVSRVSTLVKFYGESDSYTFQSEFLLPSFELTILSISKYCSCFIRTMLMLFASEGMLFLFSFLSPFFSPPHTNTNFYNMKTVDDLCYRFDIIVLGNPTI